MTHAWNSQVIEKDPSLWELRGVKTGDTESKAFILSNFRKVKKLQVILE